MESAKICQLGLVTVDFAEGPGVPCILALRRTLDPTAETLHYFQVHLSRGGHTGNRHHLLFLCL